LNEIKIFSGQQEWAFVGLDQQAKLFWSTKITGSEVYGCPEDMPVNRCLLWSPKIAASEVYGCPEDMPGAARLPNNLDLTEH
jgi:hypothetical protein